MTVRVTIRTHAAAATIVVKTLTEGVEGHNIEEETIEIEGQSSTYLHLSGKKTIEIFEHEPVAAEEDAVEASEDAPLDPNSGPGRDENDALLGKGKKSSTKSGTFGDEDSEYG